MTEETRIKIIKELNILKEKRRSYLELKKEYDNLTKTEEVKRFLELSKQLEKIKSDNESNETLITRAKSSIIKENECTHDIWVYLGSFYYVDDMFRSYSIKVPNERDKKFEYNLYGCLECDETVETSDYIKFESEHICLKTRKYVNIYGLRKQYFEYLTEMNVDETVKKLTSMFGGELWAVYIIIHLMMEM
mgnify:CR=1 FL=1